MDENNILEEIRDIHIAMDLISFGARMQVLESETNLSRRKLLKLYKALRGESPPKGMLPFSEDWFMGWEQNIHSSIFYNIYLYLQKAECNRPIEGMVKAYRLYLEQCPAGEKSILGLTRAWTLLRFISCGMIKHTKCCVCGGGFVVAMGYAKKTFICSLCCPPSRASKRNKVDDLVTDYVTR